MMRRTWCHCLARSQASMALANVTGPGGHPMSDISSSRLTARDLVAACRSTRGVGGVPQVLRAGCVYFVIAVMLSRPWPQKQTLHETITVSRNTRQPICCHRQQPAQAISECALLPCSVGVSLPPPPSLSTALCLRLLLAHLPPTFHFPASLLLSVSLVSLCRRPPAPSSSQIPNLLSRFLFSSHALAPRYFSTPMAMNPSPHTITHGKLLCARN